VQELRVAVRVKGQDPDQDGDLLMCRIMEKNLSRVFGS
jgi:hypothetical protein